ncbi:DinB family protein [Brevibacterium casei]|nr:DinB family protein [Brevibacterium casei]
MTINELFADFAQRPIDAAKGLPTLTPEELNAHPGSHPNSVAWSLWHIGREVDAQLSDLTGNPQVWEHYRDRFDLGKIGDTVGYGHTPGQAAEIVVNDQGLLVDYLSAALRALIDYANGLSADDFDVVIDDSWNPPVTRGVRLVSIVDDAAQHIGQAAYAAGQLH